MESIERQIGKPHPGLDRIPIPPEAGYLVQWFGEMSRRRGSSGFGANPLSFTEIDAWARLTERSLTPYDVRVICAIDDAYLGVMREPDDD